MTKNPEQLAAQLEDLLPDWACAHNAAATLRSQYAEIEALKRALDRMPAIVREGIADYVADTMAMRKHTLAEIDAFIRSIEIRPETLIARAMAPNSPEGL